MTERLYYTDAYTTKFRARIMERYEAGDQLALILDQTYFYPTSGGQPADGGHINGSPVVDVSVREEDNAVIHLLAKEVWADEVTAEVNWMRRFDHMQQHTGQHILSQAFIQVADVETVAFHLGAQSSTIDLARINMSGSQIEQAETLANQIIWENRPVQIHSVTQDEVATGFSLPLRKIPPVRGNLRLVEIADFDLTACGGTHVRHCGEIGLIKIVKLERRGEQLRLDFRCGRRALHDYRQKNSVINRLAAHFTTSYTELDGAVERLQEEVKQARRLIKQQHSDLLELEANHLVEKGTRKGNLTIINQVFSNREMADIRLLANQLTRNPGVVALLGVTGPATQLIFCRSNDASGDMNQLIKPALQLLGSAGGGGTALFAQGGGPATESERVQAALARAERLLMGQIRE